MNLKTMNRESEISHLLDKDFEREEYFSDRLDQRIRCREIAKKSYYERNKEAVLKKQKEYREKNRDKLREYSREYHRKYRQRKREERG